MKLKTITLRGYKSITKLDTLELHKLNALIGATKTANYFNIGDWTSCQLPNRRDK